MTRLRIKSGYVVSYINTENKAATGRQLEVLQQNWRAVEYTGKIGKATVSKIKQMVSCWSDSINVYNSMPCNKFKKKKRTLKFLTLTLSNSTTYTDNEVKRKLLTPFITLLIRKFHVEHYFWRAEAQKNGNIHFHLIIDQYIDKHEINYEWDRIQWLAKVIDSEPIWCEKYTSASTNIQQVESTKYVANYVVKYCLKDEENRKINGRIWGCSDSLRSLSFAEFPDTEEVCIEFSRCLNKGEVKTIEAERYKVYIVSVLYDYHFSDSWLKSMVEELMLQNYYYLYKEKIFN